MASSTVRSLPGADGNKKSLPKAALGWKLKAAGYQCAYTLWPLVIGTYVVSILLMEKARLAVLPRR